MNVLKRSKKQWGPTIATANTSCLTETMVTALVAQKIGRAEIAQQLVYLQARGG